MSQRRPTRHLRPSASAHRLEPRYCCSVALPAHAIEPAPGSIEGSVVHDVDANGRVERAGPDTGASGWMVWVDEISNGRFDAGEPSAVTDDNGRFSFSGIRPGWKGVYLENRPDWTEVPNGMSWNVPPGGRVELHPFLVTQTPFIQTHVGYDPTGDGLGSISGLGGFTLYLDLNHNAALDAGEPVGESWPGGSGQVGLGGVPPGSYPLRQLPLPGYRLSSPAAGFHTVTVTAVGAGGVGTFLNTDKSVITGTVFHDLDRDGIRDPGEPPHADSFVWADVNGDGQHNYPLEPYAVTDDLGLYRLTGLGSRTYVVRQRIDAERWVATGLGASRNVTVTAPDLVGGVDFGSALARPAAVYDALLFYNHSAFDGNDAASNDADDRAIDPTKRPLRSWDTAASFANISGYSRGINGVMVDVANLAWIPTADDFEFRTGNGGDPAAWRAAPAPQSVSLVSRVTVQSPIIPLSRISLTWTDGAIRNTWLRITVKATNNTGLSHPAVLYFGNLVGDAGKGAAARVDAADVMAARTGSGKPPAAVANPADFNKDGAVNAADQALVRANFGRSLSPPAPLAPAAPVLQSLRRTRGAYQLLTT